MTERPKAETQRFTVQVTPVRPGSLAFAVANNRVKRWLLRWSKAGCRVALHLPQEQDSHQWETLGYFVSSHQPQAKLYFCFKVWTLIWGKLYFFWLLTTMNKLSQMLLQNYSCWKRIFKNINWRFITIDIFGDRQKCKKKAIFLPVGRLDNRTFRSYLNEAYSLCDNLVYDN